jgi:hypothetical protein
VTRRECLRVLGAARRPLAAGQASSSSCGLAACSSACRRRKSDTGTTTAAWPPRWITSYDPVSGPLAGIRSAGWAVIVLPPVRRFRALLSILASLRTREASCHGNRAVVCGLIPLESLARTS